MISPDTKHVITPQLIIDTVAEHFNISAADIVSNKRSNNIAVPRQIAMYLCRQIVDTPYKEIGEYMGKRDHSTVIHGVNKIEDELKSSETLHNTVEIIIKKLNSN